MKYWLVIEKECILGGDIVDTKEHKFRDKEKAEQFVKSIKQDNYHWLIGPQEVTMSFEDDEKPLHDWGGSYRGEW